MIGWLRRIWRRHPTPEPGVVQCSMCGLMYDPTAHPLPTCLASATDLALVPSGALPYIRCVRAAKVR